MVEGLPDREPLFKYLNPKIIQEYAGREIEAPLVISNYLRMEPNIEEKKNFKTTKK